MMRRSSRPSKPQGFVGESIPVVNRETGEMLGIVTEADLFQLYLGLQTRIAELERA